MAAQTGGYHIPQQKMKQCESGYATIPRKSLRAINFGKLQRRRELLATVGCQCATDGRGSFHERLHLPLVSLASLPNLGQCLSRWPWQGIVRRGEVAVQVRHRITRAIGLEIHQVRLAATRQVPLQCPGLLAQLLQRHHATVVGEVQLQQTWATNTATGRMR